VWLAFLEVPSYRICRYVCLFLSCHGYSVDLEYNCVLLTSPCEYFHVSQFCKLEYSVDPGSIKVKRGSPSRSLGGVVGVMEKMSVRISPTSCKLVLSDCGKIECRLSYVSGPSQTPYLSKLDFSA
jgi:hypothetical protein